MWMADRKDGLRLREGGQDPKAYEKPTLTKGPVLSDISAVDGSRKGA
jgi:hypothetical protein